MTMKAAASDQRKLLDLQDFDTELQRNSRAAQTPPENAVIAELEARLLTVRQSLAAASGTLEDARTELMRLESDAKVVQARIDRDTALLSGTASAKDAVGIEHELESLKKRRSDLDDIELTVMEQVEDRGAAVAGIEAERDAILLELRTTQEARTARLDELARARVLIDRDRQTLVSTLPADLVALYDRQRDRYGYGASLLRGGVSRASGVTLNGSDLAAVRAAADDDVVLCPDSNAILVRTEESGL
jgi:predicted  nucleic acid-binding Zn-ribbon protein